MEPTPEVPKSPLDIAYEIADHSAEIDKLLVIGMRINGSVLTLDTGLTVDEAKKLCIGFVGWMDTCIGREIERHSKE